MKKKYPDFNSFRDNFILTDQIFDQLILFAKNEGIKYSEEDFLISKSNISTSIKSNIALNYWGTSQYFEIINQDSNAFKKALEVIESKEIYSQQLKE
jgi:carboxyl-terminal processing protease